jgi:hypothetical protein
MQIKYEGVNSPASPPMCADYVGVLGLGHCPLGLAFQPRSPSFLWQRATPCIVGWVGGRSEKVTVRGPNHLDFE